MDFSFNDEQLMLRDLARGILEKEVTLERLREVESGADFFDRALWSTLADAGLLGVVIPEDEGGTGFGLLELCVLLQEVGRAVAPVPLLPTLLLGALPIVEFGTKAQKKAWLGPIAAGQSVLTTALVDAHSSDPETPATRARKDGQAWVLEGRKRFVHSAHLAERILVPATIAEAEGSAIFLVEPRAPGVMLSRQRTSSGEPLLELELSGVRVEASEVLGGDTRGGGQIARWLYERALVGICATQIGVSERALEITSGYVSQREQFGVPIGSFQAVQHRAADGYIDLESLRWVTWRAAWKLSQGLSAKRETAVAKFWAAEAGSRIANTVQHLHAGLGVDLDYPIHRYFLWSKQLELSLGGATPQLARLGRDMAQTGPQELV
jgi:alkylation response protein AidB-like acyl-CoA dehydrogenase